jgi:cellulose synthase/poly-beta-1,6-N-acetylglucosamine synthase-like glycosyltransferase
MLSIGLGCFTLVTGIFAAYFFLIARSPRKPEYLHAIDEAMSRTLRSSELPEISILIPAYNEERVVEAKLRDIAAMQYPHDRLEVLLIDDCSTDDTRTIAERVFGELGLRGKVIKNIRRTGVNGCYNRGLQESTGDLIATTDADAMVDHEALLKSVKVLDVLRGVGGVTARMVPMSMIQTTAVRIERPYRSFYDTMCVAESAVHSTFPGYTTFAVVRRSVFPIMPLEYGSSDGNISLAIIRKGLRYICVPTLLFYEPIAESLRGQVRQKVRRAARTIQSALANKDMLFSRECGAFGRSVFPLRLLMMTVSPVLSLVGCAAILVALAYVSIYWILSSALFLLVLYAGSRLGLSKLSLLWSLLVHQCYLLIGLLLSGRKRAVWRPVQRSSVIGRS